MELKLLFKVIATQQSTWSDYFLLEALIQVALIIIQEDKLSIIDTTISKTKNSIPSDNETLQNALADSIMNNSLSSCNRLMLAGASWWFSVHPLQRFGFSLHVADFRDALSLQYG